jgi:hypothetical protein
MSEEAVIPEVAAPVAAPDASATAAPVDSPVVGEETKPEAKPEAEKPPKTFTQEELDRIVAKEKAKAERKAHKETQREIQDRVREELARQGKTQEPAPEAPKKPVRSEYPDDEQYVEALAGFKAEEVLRARSEQTEKQQKEAQRKQYQESVNATFAEKEDAARDKYEDYDEVTRDPRVPITQPMADAIALLDAGADVAYYLGTHLDDAKRIAKLHPLLQARELGRIEDKLASAPPPAKPSAAPEPIAPIGRPSASAGYVDTLDPRSLAKLGTSGWIEAERKRQIAKQKAAQG